MPSIIRRLMTVLDSIIVHAAFSTTYHDSMTIINIDGFRCIIRMNERVRLFVIPRRIRRLRQPHGSEQPIDDDERSRCAKIEARIEEVRALVEEYVETYEQTAHFWFGKSMTFRGAPLCDQFISVRLSPDEK